MAKDYTIHPRLAAEHVFALGVIETAEGVTTSGAMRLLIERYAESLRNPDLLEALDEELHDQIPTMRSFARDVDRRFDPESDAAWLRAHDYAWHQGYADHGGPE